MENNEAYALPNLSSAFLQPNHKIQSKDRLRVCLSRLSGKMENKEASGLTYLASIPIDDDDSDLLEKHLRLKEHLLELQRLVSERRSGCQAEVNAGLPHMDPWELIPEVSRQAKKATAHKDEERREKYFITTNTDLSRHISNQSNVETPQGSWKPRDHLGSVIKDKSNPSRCVGYNMTYDFYTRTGLQCRADTKTNWIMNVIALLDHDNWIQEEMFLCHVFENNSPDYDPRPKCARFRVPLLDMGKPCNEATHGPSSSSFRGTAPGSLSTHHGSNRPSESEIKAYMQQLNNHLLGDDPEISTDAGNYDSRGDENGQSRKRTRTSSAVWQRFTKIFAHGPDGVVLTLAACNHCCKVLTGDSKKGTSHLRRHKCPCNH